MAKQKHKTHAEKAASAAKNKKASVRKGKTSTTNKNKKSNIRANTVKDPIEIPVRLISATICFVLFLLFAISYFFPEGVFVRLFSNFIHGLIGRTGFVVGIPVLLYLFIIHAFSGTRPIKMRTICLIAFLLVCGCITHLILPALNLPAGISAVSELYGGGINGTTGGLICGAITMLVQWLCGTIIAYIVFIIGGLSIKQVSTIAQKE